jgi:hypothetical protein
MDSRTNPGSRPAADDHHTASFLPATNVLSKARKTGNADGTTSCKMAKEEKRRIVET